jgi:hypothetical protein
MIQRTFRQAVTHFVIGTVAVVWAVSAHGAGDIDQFQGQWFGMGVAQVAG